MRKIVPDEGARQGPKGRPILLVLIASFLLVGIYLVSMLMWSGSESPTHPSQDASRQAASPSTGAAGTGTPPANPAYPAPSGPATTGSTAR
jgi:hypothetical protein